MKQDNMRKKNGKNFMETMREKVNKCYVLSYGKEFNMNIEERKYQYLLQKAETTADDVNDRFNRIDAIMNDLKIGDVLYEMGIYEGDIFAKIVQKIIDKDNGIIETYEESIKKTETECVLCYRTRKQVEDMGYRLR
jgi:hypothetical protein